MKSAQIDYEKAGMLSPLTRDYLNGKQELRAFHTFKPDLKGIQTAFEQRLKNPVNRELLTKRLREDYRDIKTEQAVSRNIELLSGEKTFTVTTGHQLNLFTGPLYFVWKILSAVNLAQELNVQFPEYNFIPVYWPAGEDHDFEEVNHTYVHNKKYTWPSKQTGAVGRFTTEGLNGVIDELHTDLKTKLADIHLLDDLRECLSEKNYGRGVFQLVNKWFGKYGLVIVNSDHADFKKEFIKIAECDLNTNSANTLIEETAAKLNNLGYKKQITPREINLFYLTDGARNRIVKKENNYYVEDTELLFNKREIIEELHKHPERFSPNVALRPMYQETILPNIAYIGGGAEVAYWLQLKTAFEAYDVFYPAVLLRNSVLVLTEKAKKKQHQLNLNFDDLFAGEHELIKRVVINSSDKILHFQEEKAALQTVFSNIKSRMAQSDETLKSSAEAAEVKHLHYMNNLEKKLLRAEKKKNKIGRERVKALLAEIKPGGKLQERRENIFTLFCEYGEDVIEEVRNELNPLDYRLTVVQ